VKCCGCAATWVRPQVSSLADRGSSDWVKGALLLCTRTKSVRRAPTNTSNTSEANSNLKGIPCPESHWRAENSYLNGYNAQLVPESEHIHKWKRSLLLLNNVEKILSTKVITWFCAAFWWQNVMYCYVIEWSRWLLFQAGWVDPLVQCRMKLYISLLGMHTGPNSHVLGSGL
jgi:hypothetical protein